MVILAWALMWSTSPCKEESYYLEVLLATATITLSLWVSHLRNGPVNTWLGYAKVIGGAGYDLIMLLGCLLLIAIPLAIVTPAYQCYTPRAKVSEMLAYGAAARHEIDERIENGVSLKDAVTDMTIELSGSLAWGTVTSDGVIILAREDPVALIILEPSPRDKGVKGFPNAIVPAECRRQ
jgi:hypothetical protein